MNGMMIVALFGSLFLAGRASTAQPPAPQIVDPAPVMQEAPASADRSSSAARPEAPPRASAVTTPISETSASSPVRHRSVATSKGAPAGPTWDVSPRPSADKKTIIKLQPKIVINGEPEPDASHTAHGSGHSHHASKSGSSSGKTVLVHGYYRKNGVYVRSHPRRSRSGH